MNTHVIIITLVLTIVSNYLVSSQRPISQVFQDFERKLAQDAFVAYPNVSFIFSPSAISTLMAEMTLELCGERRDRVIETLGLQGYDDEVIRKFIKERNVEVKKSPLFKGGSSFIEEVANACEKNQFIAKTIFNYDLSTNEIVAERSNPQNFLDQEIGHSSNEAAVSLKPYVITAIKEAPYGPTAHVSVHDVEDSIGNILRFYTTNDAVNGLEYVEKQITEILPNIHSYRDALPNQSGNPQRVPVNIPTFAIDNHESIKDLLQKRGIADLLDDVGIADMMQSIKWDVRKTGSPPSSGLIASSLVKPFVILGESKTTKMTFLAARIID